MNEEEEPMEKKDLNEWTVKELREFCMINDITIPSGSRKADIIKIVKDAVSDPDFVDKTKPENMEEEIVAGVDEDPAEEYKNKAEKKFWQKPEFRVLLDEDLAKDSEVAFYDLASLVDNFFDNMLHEDFINYKISGIALKSAASLHHYKISSIIKEEEEIQKQEKIEEMRKRHRRKIPKTLSQPIRPKMKVATKDELFGAMKSAIIDVMQKKEKLKRRRIRRERKKRQKKEKRSKAQLPKELLKHITGQEETIDELHEKWYNRIKASINLQNEKTSLYELTDLIEQEEEDDISKKFAFIRLFLALLFLSNDGTGKRLRLTQEGEFDNIHVDLRK
ncbi:MAG: hypothetical protein ACOC44_18130 [Promethearchaeia archaeon]